MIENIDTSDVSKKVNSNRAYNRVFGGIVGLMASVYVVAIVAYVVWFSVTFGDGGNFAKHSLIGMMLTMIGALLLALSSTVSSSIRTKSAELSELVVLLVDEIEDMKRHAPVVSTPIIGDTESSDQQNS